MLKRLKMNTILWDDTFSVGVAEIDLEHQKLLEMINELSFSISEKKGMDLSGKILSGLVNYSEVHFKTEEKYFAQLSYPEMEEHIEEHDLFRQKISELIDEFGNNNPFLSIDVLEFMSKWFKNHMLQTDKEYSTFFISNGLH